MRVIVCLSMIVLFSACAAAPVEKPQPPVEAGTPESKPIAADTKKAYVPTETEKKSLGVFQEIYDLVESTGDRNAILPQIEKLYLKIISEYPEAPLAKESYLRLMTIYMDDYSPPDFIKAEALYDDFIKKYTDSKYKSILGETLGKGYYKESKWDKLIEVSAPAFKKYTDQGVRPRPSLLFMYSEANFFIGNLAEAGRAYEAMIQLFPRLNESKKAENRLKEINSKKE